MNEPRPIGLFSLHSVDFKFGYWKFDEFVAGGNRTYLFDNGEIRSDKNGEREIKKIDLAKFNYLRNGPITNDDWYWNEHKQCFIECSSLCEEDFLELMMSDTKRIAILDNAS